MDVPPPSGGGSDQGANLSLAADAEAVERQLRKRAPQLRGDELEEMLGRLEDLKKAYTDAAAAYQVRMAKYAELTMFHEYTNRPGDVEYGIVREHLADRAVRHAMVLSTVLKAASEVLKRDDGLWHAWFERDFPEVVRDIGVIPAGQQTKRAVLPEWITAAPRAEEDERYARVPWRRYYAWWQFMRRSALKEFARVSERNARDWINTNRYHHEHIATWPLNIKAVPGRQFETVALHIYSLSYSTLPNNELYLTTHSDDVFFPEVMTMRSSLGSGIGVLDIGDDDDDDTFDLLIGRSKSPLFWFLVVGVVRHQYGAWTAELKWISGGKAVVPGRYVEDGRYLKPMSLEGGLNCDYAKTFRAFACFYASALDPASGHHAEIRTLIDRVKAAPELRSTSESCLAVLTELPPAPMVDGVLYVHERICSGCAVTVTEASGQQCKTCKAPYCGIECHSKTWRIACGSCRANGGGGAQADDELLGMTLVAANAKGHVVREVARNGVILPVSETYGRHRINVETRDGVIVGVVGRG